MGGQGSGRGGERRGAKLRRAPLPECERAPGDPTLFKDLIASSNLPNIVGREKLAEDVVIGRQAILLLRSRLDAGDATSDELRCLGSLLSTDRKLLADLGVSRPFDPTRDGDDDEDEVLFFGGPRRRGGRNARATKNRRRAPRARTDATQVDSIRAIATQVDSARDDDAGSARPRPTPGGGARKLPLGEAQS